MSVDADTSEVTEDAGGLRARTRRDLDARLAPFKDTQAPLRALIALEAGRMGSWRWDIEAGSVTGDPFVAELLGLDFADQPWPVEDVFASMHPDDLPRVQARVDHALAGADIYEVEFRDRITDPATGEPGFRWLGARGRVTERGAKGEALVMVGVNWDATSQKDHEQSLLMLAREMDHRVKNAFAVIRSLISIGQRTSSSKEDLAKTLKTQVLAMAEAHALSARMARDAERPTVPVPVGDVLAIALDPWRDGRDGTKTEIVFDAHPDFLLEPNQVSAVAMLAYELTTNAAKYGALGHAGGRLHVEATHDGDEGLIRWIETTDTPDVRAASDEEKRRGAPPGFGSTLVQHCVATLGGRLKRELTPTGLHFELRVPREIAS